MSVSLNLSIEAFWSTIQCQSSLSKIHFSQTKRVIELSLLDLELYAAAKLWKQTGAARHCHILDTNNDYVNLARQVFQLKEEIQRIQLFKQQSKQSD